MDLQVLLNSKIIVVVIACCSDSVFLVACAEGSEIPARYRWAHIHTALTGKKICSGSVNKIHASGGQL